MAIYMNDLVGLSTFSRLAGKPQSTLQRYEARPDFPKPALVIEEHNRTKRLWPREALDSYFARINQERLDRQEQARERAARKRASGALHRHLVELFGPQDASFIKREELRQHDGDPRKACQALGLQY